VSSLSIRMTNHPLKGRVYGHVTHFKFCRPNNIATTPTDAISDCLNADRVCKRFVATSFFFVVAVG